MSFNKSEFKKNFQLYLMLAIPILYFLLFKYAPMFGVIVAFKDYNIFSGVFASDWVGLRHFREIFSSKEFINALKNTLILNMGELLIGFPLPIIFAIFLNELKSDRLKKLTQTTMYLPHFLSMVIVAGIATQVFSGTGIINNMLVKFGFSEINFLGNPSIWRLVYWGSGLWTGLGFGMIIYLAAMGNINTELYEAAYIDGANRWKRIWNVTLPQLKPTIIILLIMSMGKILGISFERPYLLSNIMVERTSNVISTYVYQMGLKTARFDFATAVGVFQSVLGLIMILAVNKFAKKIGEEGVM